MLVLGMREGNQCRLEACDHAFQFAPQVDAPVSRASNDLLGRRRALAAGVRRFERTPLVEQIRGGDAAETFIRETEKGDRVARDAQGLHRRARLLLALRAVASVIGGSRMSDAFRHLDAFWKAVTACQQHHAHRAASRADALHQAGCSDGLVVWMRCDDQEACRAIDRDAELGQT